MQQALLIVVKCPVIVGEQARLLQDLCKGIRGMSESMQPRQWQCKDNTPVHACHTYTKWEWLIDLPVAAQAVTLHVAGALFPLTGSNRHQQEGLQSIRV